MIFEILWCPIFTQLLILLGGIKIGCVPFLPQVCLVFTPNYGVKVGHLQRLMHFKPPYGFEPGLSALVNLHTNH